MELDTQRSGLDRREQENVVPDEHRQFPDRRAVINDADQIIEFMKKIPILSKLTDGQYRQVLRICSRKTIPKESFICSEGEESNELFILLKGRLKIILKGSTIINFLYPMGLVGEIGVFTNVRRSASVLAAEESAVLRIHKTELFSLMKNNPDFSSRLLLNVVYDLAAKLQEDNRVIEELRTKKSTMIL